jgi:Tfp pilus assembly protein FimT
LSAPAPCDSRRTRRPGGFTLIELLATAFLVARVLALAAPSFRELTLNNQRATQRDSMLASHNLARTEAVMRATPTVVCIADSAATPDCDSSSSQWEDGWIVFVDSNCAGSTQDTLDDPADRTATAPGIIVAKIF